jgi:hypothetical protein
MFSFQGVGGLDCGILVFASVIDNCGGWLFDQRQQIVTASDWQIDAIACVGIQNLQIAQIVGTVLGGRGSTGKSGEGNGGNDNLLHDIFLFCSVCLFQFTQDAV